MALSVLNQEAFVGNQNTFFFFSGTATSPRNLKNTHFLKIKTKSWKIMIIPPKGITEGS